VFFFWMSIDLTFAENCLFFMPFVTAPKTS
jgi:hypothetical protein